MMLKWASTMNTPTPTSNAITGLGGAPVPGLPDEATLARLASEFLRFLPGTAPTPSPQPLPAAMQVPAAAEPLAPLPEQPTAGGGNAIGTPGKYAAALPDVTPPQAAAGSPLPASVPSSPYYFLGEASAYAPSEAAATRDDRVTAQSFGLPGEAELKQLLAVAIPGDHPEAQASPALSGGRYYFLDQSAAGTTVPDVARSAHPPFDVNAVRKDFPILQERVNGRQLVWFDNAATTQKPQAVIDRLAYFYQHENSNIHRAAHELAARATDAYEGARDKVARFIKAGSADEIIFVRGATEAINLVANTWGRQNIEAGDEIVVSHLEHHANIVPWQELAQEKGAKIRVIPVDEHGQLLLDDYRKLLNDRTKLVAVTQVSNALGTVTPIREIIEMAHGVGAIVLVDGAQSVSHMRTDVQALDVDFFIFSGHKIYAPTGIGVVYGKRQLLEQLPPWQGGGNMIADVSFERTVFQPPPARFEAGTGNIADAVGLGAALDYVDRIGLEGIARYEHDLLVYATRGLASIPGLRLIGTAAEKASVISFVLAGYRPEDVGKALNQEGIAVRSGHHCAQPILRRFGVEATVRPSLAFYNTCAEIDLLVSVVKRMANGSRPIV